MARLMNCYNPSMHEKLVSNVARELEMCYPIKQNYFTNTELGYFKLNHTRNLTF